MSFISLEQCLRYDNMLMQLPGVEHREAGQKIARATSLVVFVDIDEQLEAEGTWAEHDPRPLIEELASRDGVLTCLLSGRSLTEMKAWLESPRLAYLADQGMEIEGPAFHFVHPEAVHCRSSIEALNQRIAGLPLLFPEVSIQARPLALTIDASRCPRPSVEEIANIVAGLAPDDHSDLMARRHHDRFEIRPRVDWGYPESMGWVRGRLKTADTALFVIGGDETTGTLEGAIRLGSGARGDAATPAGRCLEMTATLAWLQERWQERVDSMASSWDHDHARPSLAIKESSPILNVRLRRAAMDRRRASNG